MKKLLVFVAVLAVAGAAYWFYQQNQVDPLPDDIVFGNGRIEAIQVDISSLIPGRVASITVTEGDLVKPGQVVATINADALQAQLAQAEARVASAKSQVAAAAATIAQTEAVLALATEELNRTTQLAARGTVSPQILDARTTDMRVAEANLAAAKAALVANERGVDAARAGAAQIAANLDDTTLTSPVVGRVLYRLAEPGEVIGAGSRLLTLVDLSEVYLEFFLPATQAHRIEIGAEARIKLDIIDAAVPATVTFVSPVSQFTPRQVETADERQNLVFRVRVRVPQELVQRFIGLVHTGIRGVAYVRLAGPDPSPWPETLHLADFEALIQQQGD